MRTRVSRISGSRHGNLYISVSAMLIESAALYTLTAIVFLVGYALQNVLQFAAEPLEILQVRCCVARLRTLADLDASRVWLR